MGVMGVVAETGRDVVDWSRIGSREMVRKKHPRDLLSSDEAAEILGVTRSTVKRWVDAGRLRPQEARPSTRKRRGAMYFSREYLEERMRTWADEIVPDEAEPRENE